MCIQSNRWHLLFCPFTLLFWHQSNSLKNYNRMECIIFIKHTQKNVSLKLQHLMDGSLGMLQLFRSLIYDSSDLWDIYSMRSMRFSQFTIKFFSITALVSCTLLSSHPINLYTCIGSWSAAAEDNDYKEGEQEGQDQHQAWKHVQMTFSTRSFAEIKTNYWKVHC